MDNFKFEHCQQHKLLGKCYRLLPKDEIEMQLVLWEQEAIDLIGPLIVKVNNRKVKFNALTCIATVSNLVELIWINNKTLCDIRHKFVHC